MSHTERVPIAGQGIGGAYERAGDLGPIATFLEHAREQLAKRLPSAAAMVCEGRRSSPAFA